MNLIIDLFAFCVFFGLTFVFGYIMSCIFIIGDARRAQLLCFICIFLTDLEIMQINDEKITWFSIALHTLVIAGMIYGYFKSAPDNNGGGFFLINREHGSSPFS